MVKESLILIGVFFSWCNFSFAAPVTRAVALLGQPAAGIAGQSFAHIGKPAVNRNGDIVFQADLSGSLSSKGIFLAPSNGAIMPIVVTRGWAVWNFADVGDPVINDNGQVAFSALLGKGLRNSGIFLYSTAGVISVAVTGAPATGTSGRFVILGQYGLAINNSGTVVFHATFDGSEPGEGIFKFSNGTISPLVLKSQPAGGVAGARFNHFSKVAVNDSGEIAFMASLTAATAFSPAGVFVADSKGPRLVAAAGASAPYSATSSFGFFSAISINDAGDVAFIDNAVIQGRTRDLSSVGLVVRTAAGTAAVATKGMAVAGINARVEGNFLDPQIFRLSDGTNAIVFKAWSNTGGKNAVFVASAHTLKQLLQEGDAAPNGGIYSFISFPAFSASGQFAFVAALKNSSNAGGLFAGKITF